VKSAFFSYSHKDEALRDQLEMHLAMLKRQEVISTWHDRRLIAGDDIDEGVSQELERADIVLLLVSPDFLASEYCYGIEVARALERHATGEARVIPVILRPCDWHAAPFGKLLASPTDGRPVSKWPDLDEAFLDVVKAIRAVATPKGSSAASPRALAQRAPKLPPTDAGPRSSNLRMRKTFTQRDRDRFLDEAFEYMARFFENSLNELETRNPGIEVAFKRIDASRFTSSIYRNGESLARCQIRLGGHFGSGITFSLNANLDDHSINESLSVEAGEQALFLKPLGMQIHRSPGRDTQLALEGAAEYYWSLFVEPLQR
jgi:TIR domain